MCCGTWSRGGGINWQIKKVKLIIVKCETVKCVIEKYAIEKYV